MTIKAECGEPIATLLIGAEGSAEIEGQPWARPANDEEKAAFVDFSCGGCPDIYQRSLTDKTGRPYFLLTILESAPEECRSKLGAIAAVSDSPSDGRLVAINTTTRSIKMDGHNIINDDDVLADEPICPNCDDEGCEDCLSHNDVPLDGDHDSTMTSIGWGTDEDYGHFGDDFGDW